MLFLVSCDYTKFTPITPEKPVMHANREIAQLRDLIGRGPTDYNYVISGTITSSDSCGNFYKQLYIQDDTGAIELRLGVYDIYAMFSRWDKVSVVISKMSIGESNNTLQFGFGRRGLTSIDPITSYDIIDMFVFRQDGYDPDIGRLVQGADIKPIMAGEFIYIEGEFLNATTNKNTFEGLQPFLSSDNTRMVINTSSYARFAKDRMPIGKVRLRGIISFDSNGGIELKFSNLTDIVKLDL